MCLRITKEYRQPLWVTRRAWKVLVVEDSGIRAPIRALAGIDLGRWMSAEGDTCIKHEEGCYRPGWHVFTNEHDAEFYSSLSHNDYSSLPHKDTCVMQVLVRGIQARGFLRIMNLAGPERWSLRCLVARQLYVPVFGIHLPTTNGETEGHPLALTLVGSAPPPSSG